MRRQLLTGLGMTIALTVLVGLAYPLMMTGVSQVVFPGRANGSLVSQDGHVVGSTLLGQSFTRPEYFQPRPSAAGDGYDGLASGASNLGPGNQKLLDAVTERVDAYRRANGLGPTDQVPVDAVTASASGLDPQISVANARIQARRVAAARSLPVDRVQQLVDGQTSSRAVGVLGERAVNVLALNLDLDALARSGPG